MAKRRKASRRAHGEGSVSQVQRKRRRKDGSTYLYTVWEAEIATGMGPDGRARRKHVYASTQREALAKLDRIKQELATGTYSATKKTLGVWLEQWLDQRRPRLKQGSIEQYEYVIRRHIVPDLGGVRLDKLTPSLVEAVMANTIKRCTPAKQGAGDRPTPRSRGVATANKVRTVLHAAMKQAVRQRLVNTMNPVDAVDPLPVSKREMLLWTPMQAAGFLDAARPHRLFALFYLAMSTGLRRGELLGLRWGDIHGSNLTVQQSLVKAKGGGTRMETPKNHKTRTVGLSPDALEVLMRHRQLQEAEREQATAAGYSWPTSDLVFTSEVGTPIHPDNPKRVLNAFCNEASVPRVRPHDLRHLYSSVCIASGVDPKELAHRLGHARASFTLDRYTHLFAEHRSASTTSLLDFLPKAGQSN